MIRVKARVIVTLQCLLRVKGVRIRGQGFRVEGKVMVRVQRLGSKDLGFKV